MCRNHLNSVGGASAAIAQEYRPYAERVEVRGLADVDLAKAEAFKEQYGGAYATTDPDRLFADPDLDAVIIATWHDTHAPYSLKATAAASTCSSRSRWR